jgi:hypothetical protein
MKVRDEGKNLRREQKRTKKTFPTVFLWLAQPAHKEIAMYSQCRKTMKQDSSSDKHTGSQRDGE